MDSDKYTYRLDYLNTLTHHDQQAVGVGISLR
jgi:hypothetical protein